MPSSCSVCSQPVERLDQPKRHTVLGWAADHEVVLLDDTQPDRERVIAHPLDGDGSRELSRVERTSSYGLGRLQLAAALLADLDVRDAGGPDQEPGRIGVEPARGVEI